LSCLLQILIQKRDDFRNIFGGFELRPAVSRAFERLLRNLEQTPPPLSLLSQYLPQEYEQVREGNISPQPRALLMAHVTRTLETYRLACEG
jgi:D-tagatose-1,6-bisphosphate aldolase subunit GatZ/KbaZ